MASDSGGPGVLSASERDRQYCELCGKMENLLRCGRCRSSFYCCKEHQRQDWKKHKLVCQGGEAPARSPRRRSPASRPRPVGPPEPRAPAGRPGAGTARRPRAYRARRTRRRPGAAPAQQSPAPRILRLAGLRAPSAPACAQRVAAPGRR